MCEQLNAVDWTILIVLITLACVIAWETGAIAMLKQFEARMRAVEEGARRRGIP